MHSKSGDFPSHYNTNRDDFLQYLQSATTPGGASQAAYSTDSATDEFTHHNGNLGDRIRFLFPEFLKDEGPIPHGPINIGVDQDQQLPDEAIPATKTSRSKTARIKKQSPHETATSTGKPRTKVAEKSQQQRNVKGEAEGRLRDALMTRLDIRTSKADIINQAASDLQHLAAENDQLKAQLNDARYTIYKLQNTLASAS